jgi:methionyl-tRNA synthetase
MRKLLNLPANGSNTKWDEAGKLTIPEGHTLGQPEILFVKIEDTVIEKEIEKLKAVSNQPKENMETKDLISIEDFGKIELRVAEVIEAEKMPNTEKLLKLQILLGDEKRQIVAGVAEHYKSEQLIGKQIIIVANLEPISIRNEVSQGMLLAAEAGGQLTLLTTLEKITCGAKVG